MTPWLSGATNGCYFNSDKCKILHLGSNNPRYTYKMKDGSSIKDLVITECEKDLGVYVDGEMIFELC